MSIDWTGLPQTDPALLLRYRDRQYAAEMMAVAIGKLNLFTWLNRHDGATTDQIRTEFQLADRPLDVLLTLCRAGGFLQTDGTEGRHSLTPLGREHLVDSSPWFLGPYYRPIMNTPIAESCLQSLRTGRPSNWQADAKQADWHQAMLRPDFARDFTDLMNCRGLAMGQTLAAAAAGHVRERRHLLDVGGGSGIYALAIAARFSDLRATVLEQSPVDQLAAAEIDRHGMSDRVDVVTADMFDDPWPDQCDAILLSNVLHDWDWPEVRRLIRRTADSLPSGGIVLVHEAFLEDDKSGPLAVAEYSVLLATITQGKCYSRGEYAAIFAENDFDVAPLENTIADRGFFIATKR